VISPVLRPVVQKKRHDSESDVELELFRYWFFVSWNSRITWKPYLRRRWWIVSSSMSYILFPHAHALLNFFEMFSK
jgi:hypothetical protein